MYIWHLWHLSCWTHEMHVGTQIDTQIIALNWVFPCVLTSLHVFMLGKNGVWAALKVQLQSRDDVVICSEMETVLILYQITCLTPPWNHTSFSSVSISRDLVRICTMCKCNLGPETFHYTTYTRQSNFYCQGVMIASTPTLFRNFVDII